MKHSRKKKANTVYPGKELLISYPCKDGFTYNIFCDGTYKCDPDHFKEQTSFWQIGEDGHFYFKHSGISNYDDKFSYDGDKYSDDIAEAILDALIEKELLT